MFNENIWKPVVLCVFVVGRTDHIHDWESYLIVAELDLNKNLEVISMK